MISLPLWNAYLRGMIRMTLLSLLLASPAAATTQEDVLSGQFLPGWQTDSGTHMTALDLALAPGWKTYWRSPGDAGIPPSFDWAGSRNVKSVRFHWPAPTVFHTNGMQSIGYHDRLVLPIEVTPIDPSQPIHIAAAIDLGVCDAICLPANLAVSADLVGPGAPDALIRAALAKRAATPDEAGVTAIACAVEPIADGLRLTASINLPHPGSDEVVAFETADPGVWIAESTESREGGTLVAVTELVDRSGSPFALDRSAVTVTVLTNEGAVELRGCPAAP